MEVTERDGWFLMESSPHNLTLNRYAQFQTLGGLIAINAGQSSRTSFAVWMEPDEAILFGEKLVAAAKAIKEKQG